MRYLPFLNGIYSTAPGLVPVARNGEGYNQSIFQTDDLYNQYIKNKFDCRKENIAKYYLEESASAITMQRINNYMVKQLQKEHPSH